jgi:autotransporter adhesin
VSVAGTTGDRRVTGVANGDVAAGSTDAANGGQVFAIKQKVEQLRAINSTTAVDSRGDGSDAATVRGGTRGVAVGSNASTQGLNAVAVGSRAKADGEGSVAIGSNTSATAANSVAIGQNSQADRINTVSVGARGAERQITNLAPATQDTDAVNLGQTMSITRRSRAEAVEEANAYTDSEIGALRSDAYAGTAAAMAMASLPQVTREGAGMVSLSGSTFEGQSAAAVGVSGMSNDGRWIYKASGAATTRGNLGMTVGVGYQW